MRFPVDKTNRTIKGILAHSVGEWLRGRDVHVEEVDPSWAYEGDLGQASLEQANGKGPGVFASDWASHYGAIRPSDTWVVVVADVAKTRTARSPRSVTIYIPRLDHGQMDVARDALLIGDKQLIATALEPFGPYAGIARAILERQIRSFAKAMHPKKSTRQIRREVDDFLRSQGRA